jgi:rhodanese-related sulfurtransferase
MAKTLGDFVREARVRIREWGAETAHERLAAGSVLVIDVREPDEFAAGHLPGALCVPRGTLEGAADPGYRLRVEPLCRARRQPILLYCQTGARSAMAAVTLQEMGFGEVYSLAGGVECWVADGYILEN